MHVLHCSQIWIRAPSRGEDIQRVAIDMVKRHSQRHGDDAVLVWRVDDGNWRQDARKGSRISEQGLLLQERLEDVVLWAVTLDNLQYDISPDRVLSTRDSSLRLGMSQCPIAKWRTHA